MLRKLIDLWLVIVFLFIAAICAYAAFTATVPSDLGL